MSTAETERLLTADEFLALPDDGRERWLRDGRVHEIEGSMTVRDRVHSGVVTKLAHALEGWIETRPAPRGLVHTGDAGFRLRRDPDVLVGADVALASPELVAATPPGRPYYDGPPLVAVEVLSPSDRHEDVVEKVRLSLEAGSVAWLVDPDLRHVTVYRPDGPARIYGAGEELAGGPELPGFRVAVSRLFPH